MLTIVGMLQLCFFFPSAPASTAAQNGATPGREIPAPLKSELVEPVPRSALLHPREIRKQPVPVAAVGLQCFDSWTSHRVTVRRILLRLQLACLVEDQRDLVSAVSSKQKCLA